MGLYSAYKTDVNKEVNGVEVQLPANDDGTTPVILVSRLGGANKQYARAIEHAQKPYRRQIQLGTMDKELHEKLVLEVFASHIIKGWSNVQDETNTVIPYTTANAVKLLTDLPALYDELFNQSNSIESFRSETMEADAKN